MERKEFLKAAGTLGLASLLPFQTTQAAVSALAKAELADGGGCVLIPQETDGPYPLDLSKSAASFRKDVTEGKTGLPLNLTLTIVNVNNNCNPIPNARVDIWHCDKDGYYSGYNNMGYLGTQNNVGKTFCSGIQMTDSNGQVQFTTIYPGWYSGRITHIHFQVFLNSVLKATSQLAFPDSLNNTVYQTPLYAAHGQNSSVTSNSRDMVFSDSSNTQYEIATAIANAATGGYDASLTVGVAAPTTGVINLEPETGGQFILQSNYPNPFSSATTIPFMLTNPSTVMIEVYDMAGRKVIELFRQIMGAGEHTIVLDRQSNGALLAEGNYVYQLTVENANGFFRQCKVLSVMQ